MELIGSKEINGKLQKHSFLSNKYQMLKTTKIKFKELLG